MDRSATRSARTGGEHSGDRFDGCQLEGRAANPSGEVGGGVVGRDGERRYLRAPQHERLGEHEWIVHDQPRWHEHQPTSREPMPARGGDGGEGDRERAGDHCGGGSLRPRGDQAKPDGEAPREEDLFLWLYKHLLQSI